jgi:hypothetical protein
MISENQKLINEIYKYFHKLINKEMLYAKEISHIQACFEMLEKNLKGEKIKKNQKNK